MFFSGSMVYFWWYVPFFQGKVYFISVLLGMLVTEREPTPGYNDAYSVGTPKWAFWRKKS